MVFPCSCFGLPCNGLLPKCSLTRGRAADENGLILNDHIKEYNMTNSRLCKTVRNRFQNSRLRDSKSTENETSRTTKTRFWDFEIRPTFCETHVFRRTILYTYITSSFNLAYISCVIYVGTMGNLCSGTCTLFLYVLQFF